MVKNGFVQPISDIEGCLRMTCSILEVPQERRKLVATGQMYPTMADSARSWSRFVIVAVPVGLRSDLRCGSVPSLRRHSLSARTRLGGKSRAASHAARLSAMCEGKKRSVRLCAPLREFID